MKKKIRKTQLQGLGPECGGKMVKIVYGEPNAELMEAAERGEIILGGCCVVVDEDGDIVAPKWGCVNCDNRFKLWHSKLKTKHYLTA
jgi:hypothetical protein